MLKFFVKFIYLSLVVVIGLLGREAHAQNQAAPSKATILNIAVLDLASIRRNATVVKSVLGQLQAYRAEFRTRIQKEDTALKAANQELAKKRTLLSPEAFSQERRKFEQKVVEVQKLVQVSKQALDQVNGKAMLEVDNALNSIIKKIAENRNLSLILRRDVTILTSRSLDITAEVLKELNVILPKVQVEKPVLK